jgi:hypothetical protein
MSGWQFMGSSGFCPLFSEVFSYLYKWFFGNLAFNNFTLDLDSLVVTRYGEQQDIAIGYKPKKQDISLLIL